MSHCAINNSNKTKYTCFNKISLIKLAKNLNLNKNAKIKLSSLKKKLWNDINNYMKNNNICDNELCWIDNSKDSNRFFKPKVPYGKYKWLTTSDLDLVLNQYNNSNFKYLGALPSDYYTYNPINLHNKEYNGLIFNLDPHYKSGSHWVSIFLDNKKKELDYFDSTGYDIDVDNIQAFIDNPLFKKYKKNINKKIHQKLNNDCGIYCIYFITNRLKGKSFNAISNKIINDSQMNKKRSVFFRPI